jgi:hypothetical protein
MRTNNTSNCLMGRAVLQKSYGPIAKHLITTLALFLLLLVAGLQAYAGGTAVYTITSGATSLTIRSYGTNNYGIGIQMGSAYYEQTQPCAVEVVTGGGVATWITGPYSSVQDMGGSTYKCTGTKTSANGSVFTFTDTYSLSAFSIFQVSRSVAVTTANGSDAGFSTRLVVAETTTSAMTDYDFFAPGVWYKDNADVAASALATDYNDNFYWFREDRLPLPLFMLRKKSTGITFSVCHKNPDAATFTGEDGLNRVIDGRMKFASIGMQNKTQPAPGILFPGSEGERTGIYGMSSTTKWALRANPVTLGYTQNYTLAMRLTYESDFPAALKNTWGTYYGMFNPALYNCNLTTIYNQQLGLLNSYWSSINSSAGFPFRVKLNGTVESSGDYNWNMGFVGMQLPNAAILLREGINANNATMISRAEQIADWWSYNAITSTGCPKTWYDPNPQTWRNEPVYARVVGDGMQGLLWAWNFEKKRGVDKPSWLNACYRVANWLITKQNADGSFPRSWNYATNAVTNSEKTNTSHIIPFLVDMYKVTGNTSFRTAAVNAGNYIYTNTYQNYKYVGGTPDNPNVPDKEAASMALRAFLALYDADGSSNWLNAATQTAYYYETWVYSWSVPIPADDATATYPKTRSTSGLSIVATGNNSADSYAAIDAFSFYRLYLYNGDSHLLQMSRMLLQNTKQVINWDSANTIYGHGVLGIMQEALNVMIPRGHGVGYYLPWQTYNMMEPFVLLWDTFGAGTYDINTINGLSNKNTSNNNYSATRNYANSNSETIVNGGIYIIVNRNSGRILDVAGESVANGGNIQQWQYLSKTSQQWKAVLVNGYYELIAQNSNKCAEVEAGSTANGANISQNAITGSDRQLWTIAGVGGGYWKIVNKGSSKVMDVAGFSLADGGNVSQYTDSGTANQQWLFIRIGGAQGLAAMSVDEQKKTPEESTAEKISLYPNPATQTINVQGDKTPVETLGVFNNMGTQVISTKADEKQINVSRLPIGVYYVKVKKSGKVSYLRFIKN